MSIKRVVFLLISLISSAIYAAHAEVFVSFSMPEQLLEETLRESVRLNIPVYLNGLHQNSMHDTALKVIELSQAIPKLNLQIDPTRFEYFGITQTPALVVEEGDSFDVIYGHLSLKEGLLRIAESDNDSGLNTSSARRLLGE